MTEIVSRDGSKQGWLTVFAGAFGVAAGVTALPFYTIGLFFLPLSHAFGWTRTQTSAAVLFNTATSALVVPLMGKAADRFGARPVALLSLLGFGLAYLGYLLVNAHIWTFYLAGMMVNAAGAGTSAPLWTRGVSSWFDRRRGLAIGLTLLGSGMASVLAPPYVGHMIDLYGWRVGFVALAAIPVLIGAPIVFLFYREAPVPPPGSAGSGPGPAAGGISLGAALRTPRFWRMGAGVFLAAATLAAFIVHFVPMATGFGLPRGLAVGLASEIGLAVVLGRLVTGILLDRLPVTVLGGSWFFVCALALLALSLGPPPSLLKLQAVVLIVGLGAGAEIDFFTYSASRYFGMRSYSELCGWLFGFFALGGGLGPVVAGALFDHFGSYDTVLKVSAAGLVCTAALFASLGRYPSVR
jgi:MFS family permease